MSDESGFTLIETVCAMAVVALAAILLVPLFPSSTSRPGLESEALRVAALLKADRLAAIRSGRPVSTRLDAESRRIASGAAHDDVVLPGDVAFNAVLAKQCDGHAAADRIDFFPDGGSCGGVVLIARQGLGYQVRVNWLTGGVDVARADR